MVDSKLTLRLISLCVASCLAPVARGQEGAANSYRGLVPGQAPTELVMEVLGPSPIETADDSDLRYPSPGHPALNDRIFFREGRLALATSASDDERYPNRDAIESRLGSPDAEILFQTQEYLDYTSQGLRFICEASGRTIGVLYFAPIRRRIPQGSPSVRVDLRRELPPPSTPAVVPPGDFRVGAAQISIAPERFDNLTADAQTNPPHLAEDLFARAAVFERSGTRVAFVGLDVFGMSSWDLEKLLATLRGDGFDNVIIAMSHTHANVDTIGFYGYYPKEYAALILERAEEAVRAAAENLQGIKQLRLGSTEMSLAGGRVVDLVRNGRDPGIADPTVSLLQAIGKDGRPIVNVVNLACHPEVIRLRDTNGLSPDFVGRLCNEVTRQLGGQTVFLNGTLGGMLTPDTRFRTQAAAEEMGQALAKYVVEAAGNAVPSSTYDLWTHHRPVEYPVTAESIAQFLENAPGQVDFHQGRVRTEMNAVWIGDAQYITIPGELLPDIGLEIMSHMTGRLRMIVGLANGELGYLIPSFDFRAGGYEERTGPGAAGGPITRSVGLELAPLKPPSQP